jgi:hypothetical protein
LVNNRLRCICVRSPLSVMPKCHVASIAKRLLFRSPPLSSRHIKTLRPIHFFPSHSCLIFPPWRPLLTQTPTLLLLRRLAPMLSSLLQSMLLPLLTRSPRLALPSGTSTSSSPLLKARLSARGLGTLECRRSLALDKSLSVPIPFLLHLPT